MQPRALDHWKDERPPAPCLFSETAQALGARCFATGPGLALSFREAALELPLLRQLQGHSALSLIPDPAHPARLLMSGSKAELQELSAGNLPIACLLAAQEAAQRPLRSPLVMGVLNLTPDSFSDGGLAGDLEHALARAMDMVHAGANLIDVGGESTRPGSAPITAEVEIARTEPLIRALCGASQVPVSIDTTKASVARAAIRAGASMVNDISAGRFDPEMLDLVAKSDVDLVFMHMQKTPKEMQEAPHYEDPVDAVLEHLRERVSAGLKAGIQLRRMALDPGIGFGKRLNDNLLLMRSLVELRSLGLPVLVGASRKSMLGALSGQTDPALRGPETLAAQCFALQQGAEIHRVHAVQECVAALKVSAALGGQSPWAKASTHTLGSVE